VNNSRGGGGEGGKPGRRRGREVYRRGKFTGSRKPIHGSGKREHTYFCVVFATKKVRRQKPKKTWRERRLKSTGSDNIGKPCPLTLSTEALKIWVSVLADIWEI